MKIYHFHDPQDFNFAQALRRGTWYPKGATICPECDSSRQKRVSPLIIEWESGSDRIGDFIWPSGDDLVVTQRVRDAFEGRFQKLEFSPVQFSQLTSLKQPKVVSPRSKPRVLLPYVGLTLWDVIPTKWCRIDYNKSGVTIVKECRTCGKIIYKKPPWNQRHVIVDPLTWSGESIFHIQEYSGGIFCTDLVKRFIEESGFTNISFLEDGEIPI